MKISVLILTHNRPELFKRCIASVLENMPDDVEVLVNNDSNDIEEVSGAQYYYDRDENLSNIYNFLINKAKGEYLYFLEDDDYVMRDFWDIVLSDIESNMTLFYNYIPHSGVNEYIKRFHNTIPEGEYTREDFLKLVMVEHFQISQFMFRKQDMTCGMEGNYLNNDYKLFLNIDNNILYKQLPIFTQTVDGQDNISFEEYCSDGRFKGQH
jgi:glycosyltransferase involved in cell wall biosynthesis